MSSLVVGFSLRMRKRVASAQGEATLGSEGPNCKYYKHFGPTEEV